MSALDVVFEDADLLVLNKPAGLLCVPGRGEDKQDCLSARVQQYAPDALVVHRLDMATSGLVVMARGLFAQRALNDAFAQRAVQKRYMALVHGDCSAQTQWQTIHLPISVDWPNRPLRVIDHTLGKPSITRWRCLSYDPTTQTSRVEMEPLTGRTHQLRVHLLAIGHPMLGDALYAPAAVQAMQNRLTLHASELGFAHPVDGRAMHWNSPPPF